MLPPLVCVAGAVPRSGAALTAAVQLSHFAPVFVGFSGELVRNMAYDRQKIGDTKGVWLDDARIFGWGLCATAGAAEVRNQGDWQLSLGWRWLGSDAVPDAFVDSDLAGGGTNVRGVTAGLLYGLGRDTQFGLRWLSGRTISSPTERWFVNDCPRSRVTSWRT